MDEDDIGASSAASVPLDRTRREGRVRHVIEITIAHGYLLSQFMSTLFNRREDAYGSSFEKRMRVPVEVIRGIRKRLGPDFPLFFRCSVEEYLPGGITLELARDIARTVADNGIDLFNVSVGLGETNRFTGPPPCLPKGLNADRAAAIGKPGDVPLWAWPSALSTGNPPTPSSIPATPIRGHGAGAHRRPGPA